jgi:O-acetyl-ADP-ribose deacetylase (regulator of RNase III)
MIEYQVGNILRADCEALVNTVNCVGVMGRGIARQFKDAFPANFKAYEIACEHKEVQPGKMFVFETDQIANPKFIVNFPTKRHWRGKSRIEDIDTGLQALREEIEKREIRSIAIPPLGSGLGGLDWRLVKPKIEKAVANIDGLRVVVFEPNPAKEDKKTLKSSQVPKMTVGRASLVVLMHQYLTGLMDPFVTLLEIHKLMYFMQAAGHPLNLRYNKAPYGPFADNLTHVLRAIEGHFISGYTDGGDAPNKRLELVSGAVPSAQAVLRENAAAHSCFRRVADLVQGFETPFGLELLSTVHWLAVHENLTNLDELTTQTYAWNEWKKQFSQRQIRLAANRLTAQNWISLAH